MSLVLDVLCFAMRETSCCLFLTVIYAFSSTSRYLVDVLNIDNPGNRCLVT